MRRPIPATSHELIQSKYENVAKSMGKTTQKANELDVNITSRYVKYEDIINGIIPKDTLPIILIQVIVLIISFSPFPCNYIHSISRCAAEAAKQ